MSSSPLLQSIAEHMIVRRYSKRTVESYLYWIKCFILFNQKKHPTELGHTEVIAFLTWLAVERHVASATQAMALNALAYLYNKYLNKPLGDVSQFRRSSRQLKLPVVLTREEVGRLLKQLRGKQRLLISLLYGSGLRRIELVRLRIKDVDLDHLQLQIWNGKGNKHRLVTLAPELVDGLKHQADSVRMLLQQDLCLPEFKGVYLPDALAGKYPNA